MYPIGTVRESVENFIARVEPLFRDENTAIYMDTSFAMWLVKGSTETRNQFVEWAKGLGGRIHVPVWTYHEFYRHHQHDTLRADLKAHAQKLKNATNEFVEAARLVADQPLYSGLSEDHFLRELDLMKGKVGEMIDAAQRWNYEEAAAHIARWLSEHLCQSRIVFDFMATLGQVGSTRFSQDVPPGFLDRIKEDSKEKGSNRYGDLIFWEEVLGHVPTTKATSVILLTRDRKFDWFAKSEDPEISADLRWIRRWNPVPAPHPTLTLELMQRSAARQLVLLDNLYLGSILWSADSRKYSRLIAYALGMTPGVYEQERETDQPKDGSVVKARPSSTEPASKDIKAACDAALDPKSDAAVALSEKALQTPHEAEEFVDKVTGEFLAAMSVEERAAFSRLVADKALQPENPGAKLLAEKLLLLASSESALIAAPIYVGLLTSAYYDGTTPRDVPQAFDLQGMFNQLSDKAFERACRFLGTRLEKAGSRALFIPHGQPEQIVLRFVHDAEQPQVPLVLVQILLDSKGLLGKVGSSLPSNLGRVLNGQTSASIETLLEVVAHRYGLPEKLMTVDGGKLDDIRTIPVDLGFLQVDAIIANERDASDDNLEDGSTAENEAPDDDGVAEPTVLEGDDE
jgi:hypothetical protein